MESLNDILKKKTRTGMSAAGTGMSSADADKPACSDCKGAGFVYPRLPSGTPDYSRISPCRCQASGIERDRLSYLEKFSNLSPFSRMVFETFEPQRLNLTEEQRENLEAACRTARDFARHPQGWLVLQGANGCGKTHLAAAIGNHQLKLGRPVFFVTVPDLLDHLRSTFSPDSHVSYDELFDRVRNTPLLILDDLGEHSATPWAREKLYQIINHRYNLRLATVFTTCLALDDIEIRMSSRMADLMVSNVFNITAPDSRTDLKLSRTRNAQQRKRNQP